MLKCDGCSKNLSGNCSDCPDFAAEMHKYNEKVNYHVHDMFMRIMFGRITERLINVKVKVKLTGEI